MPLVFLLLVPIFFIKWDCWYLIKAIHVGTSKNVQTNHSLFPNEFHQFCCVLFPLPYLYMFFFSLHEQSPPIVNTYFLLFPYNLFLLDYWIRNIFSTVLGLLGRVVKWIMSNSCAYAKRIHIKKYCITLVHFFNAVSKNWKRSCAWRKTSQILFLLYIHICSYIEYTYTHICMIEPCLRCFVRCPKHMFVPHKIFVLLKISELKGQLVASLCCCIFKEQRYIKFLKNEAVLCKIW